MRKTAFIIMALFLISFASASFKFPEPFIQGDKADFAIILSNTSTQKQQIVAAQISAWMHTELAKSSPPVMPPISGPIPRVFLYDNENGFEDRNLISLSVQCNNKISNLFYNFNEDCSNFLLNEKTGLIRDNYIINVFESPYNSSKIVMVVLAYDEAGLKQAVDYLEEKPEFFVQTIKPEENFCSDVGLREEGKYCSSEKVWVEQKQKEVACENHFECASNFCVSQKCIKPSLIDRIIRWIKQLFS